MTWPWHEVCIPHRGKQDRFTHIFRSDDHTPVHTELGHDCAGQRLPTLSSDQLHSDQDLDLHEEDDEYRASWSSQIAPGKVARNLRRRNVSPGGAVIARSANPGAPAAPSRLPKALTSALSNEHGSQLDDGKRWSDEVGADVSHAHVVTGEGAQAAAASINAQAFTLGDRVFLGDGVSATSDEGASLMRHELTHVAQQRGATIPSYDSLAISSPGDASEHEADRNEVPAPTGRAVLARKKREQPDPFGGLLESFGSVGGDALPHRAEMEQLFGNSFDDVNVSLGRSADLAGTGAGAATRGRDVMFAGREPSRHLVAHELTHVVQNRGATASDRGDVAGRSSVAELEADEVASRVQSSGASGPTVKVSATPAAAVHFGPPDSDGKDKKKVDDDLSLGDKNFEIRGERVALKTAWLAEDDMLVPTAKAMLAPDKLREILFAWKKSGVFYWLRDAEIPNIAKSLTIEGPLVSAKAFSITLGPAVFKYIGPPPGVIMQWRRDGDGMYLVISVAYLRKLPSVNEGRASLSAEFTKKMFSSLEAATGMEVLASQKAHFASKDLSVAFNKLLNGRVLDFDKGTLQAMFGKDKDGGDKWEAWTKDKSKGASVGGSGALTGGIAFHPTVGIEDREFYLSMMKKIGGSGGGGSAVPISAYVIEMLRKIPGHKNEAEIIAALRGGAGSGTPMNAITIKQVIESVEVDKALAASGKKPRDKSGKKPRFDELVRGRIISRDSRIWPKKKVAFDFKVENKRTDRDVYLVMESTYTDVDWWAHPEGEPKNIVGQERTVNKHSGEDFFNVKFPRDGNYVIHAVANHTWYRQAHFEERVQVKSERKWLGDVEGEAYAGMGAKNEDFHDFDTGWFNELYGDIKYEHGRKFSGQLPKDWKHKSFAERTRFIGTERDRMNKLIDTYGSSGFRGHKDIVKYAKDFLATLKTTEDDLNAIKKAGYTFFEARGTYLSNKGGVPDKQLHLIGAAKRTDGEPPKYKVKIEDFTQIAEPETLHFSATNSTLKGAIEEVFLDVCKAYPPGRVSMLTELLDETATKTSGKTYGFELHTGTAWKSVKSTVWDPTVKIVVNIAGAATMIFLPATAPILFPLLASYNIADTVDNLIDKHKKGILDTKDIALGVMEIGMNVLPYLGQARAFANFGKTTLFVIDGIEIGADVVMMTVEGMDQLRKLRDQNISEIAKEYEWVQMMEKNNNYSHPDYAARKAALTKKIEETRNLGNTIFAQMAVEGAIMLASPVAFNHIAARARRSEPGTLIADELWIQKDGSQPKYDPKSGKIVGDKNNYEPAKLKKAAADMEADITKQQARYADILGTGKERVSILREGSELEVVRFETPEGKGDHEFVVKIPKGIDPAQVDLYLKKRVDEGIDIYKGTDSASYRGKSSDAKTGKPGTPAVPVPGRTEGSTNVRHITHGHNHIIGSPMRTKAEGHALLRRLAEGDESALSAVGMKAPKGFDSSAVEWGLGYRKSTKEYVLVRGEPDAVDWGPFPDLVGVAHSHPFRESRRLKGTGRDGKGVPIEKMVKGGGHNSGNQTKVFPSASDIAYSAREGLASHDVHTPYIHRGGGIIGNPKKHKKGEPTLSFSIKNATEVGRWAETEIPVYTAQVVAHSGGKVIWRGEIVAVHHPTVGSLLHFGKPESAGGAFNLTPSKATAPAAGKTRTGADKVTKPTPAEAQAQADWDRLLNDTSRDYKGKFKFNYEDWVAHYREGWHFDFDAPTRNPWRKAGAKKRHKPKYFAKKTSADAVYRSLMGKGKSFRAYAAMLKKLGVVKNKKDILDAIDDIKLAGRSHDAVRHELKTRFHDQVVARLAEPDVATMKTKHAHLPWDTDPKGAYSQASHAEMLEHTAGLNSSDKGNLTEDWYVSHHAKDKPKRHVPINRADHPGAHMEGDRVADILGVVDPGKIQNNRIGEIKSTDAAISEHDRKQFADYAKFLATGGKLKVDGTPIKIKGVRYIFTSPAGVKANRTFIETNLARTDIEVTFEVFTKDGKSHILKKLSDVTPEMKAEWE